MTPSYVVPSSAGTRSAIVAAMMIAFLSLFSLQVTAQVPTHKTLYRFQGGLFDGRHSYSRLVRDSAGNFYGTTASGGIHTCAGNQNLIDGCGTVFKWDTTGHESILYRFFYGQLDGQYPYGDLALDSAGNIYGTTTVGGLYGFGTVFKLDPAGNETILHNFSAGADGGDPMGGVVVDGANNIYGTTTYGGYGYGTVFKIDRQGVFSTFHSFINTDGATPYGSLSLDQVGNLYGTTFFGGDVTCNLDCGTVFSLDATGVLTVLHQFTGDNDDRGPYGGITRDAAGNLYGTTLGSGEGFCTLGQSCGTVFKLDKANGYAETVLYTFSGGTDGGAPYGQLTADASGNVYGTTYYGGRTGSPNCNRYGCGVVFQVDASGVESVLYSFAGGPDGGNPRAGVIRTASGALYGVALNGGSSPALGGSGTIFRIKP